MSTSTTTTEAPNRAVPAAKPRRPRPQVMSVTPAAAQQVKALIENRGKDTAGIRIGVNKGAAYDLFLTRSLKNAKLVREGIRQLPPHCA